MKLPRDTLTFILAVCALLLLISFFSFAAYFASSDIEALNETGQLPSGTQTTGALFTNQTPLSTNTTTTQVGGSRGGGGRGGSSGGGGGGSGGGSPAYQCSDSIDNDLDNATDWPNDFSCSDASDNNETNPKAQCQDGIDNDNDGLIDYPNDAGCANLQDNSEQQQPPSPSLLITRPVSNEIFNRTNNLPLEINITNFNAATCFYSLDGAQNATMSNCTSARFNALEGFHYLNAYARNNSNYILTASVNFSVNITVPANIPPVAQFIFNPLSGQAPLNVMFNASGSYDSDGTIVAYTWNFGDGVNGSGIFTFHTYNVAGNYTIRLTVRDDAGANTSATSVVTVSQASTNLLPIANFTANPTNGIAPLTVDFNASSSSDPDGNIISYQWDFGEGFAGSGQIAQHIYNSAGNYTVNLTVQDNNGALGSASSIIVVTNGTGGTGGGDWIEVCTPQDLDNVRNNLTANYRQVCDIDLVGYNWLPIGLSDNDPFTGVYDGQNHIIANFNYYNDSGAPRFYGLFGAIFHGELKNLRISNASIIINNRNNNVGNARYVGPVAGYIFNTSVMNVHVDGSLEINNTYGTVGGFIGAIQAGTVSDSSASVTVNATRISNVGGFTSNNNGVIINSSAAGDVFGYRYVGGLVGSNYGGTIIDSSATGNVEGDSWVGGLVGAGGLVGNITGSWASGNVIGYGISTGFLGGLVGSQYEGFINNSFATGNVATRDMNNSAGTFVGGLVGDLSSSSVFNSDAYGNVSGYAYVGGLVGRTLIGNISDSEAHGNVNASMRDSSAAMVGGLVGSQYEGFINNSFATGNVNGGQRLTGGLAGITENSIIQNSYSLGDIYGNESVGGLIGEGLNVQIVQSYAQGNIRGEFFVGGLVGGSANANIFQSFAQGNVGGKTHVGGLVGAYTYNATIFDSYALGNVIATDSINSPLWNGCSDNSLIYAGGLVGCVWQANIVTSYSTGAVNAANVNGAGGLVGKALAARVNSSYWDTQTSGQSVSAGGEGRTTAQMQTQSNYAGWDFTNVWEMLPDDYPHLAWEMGACGPLGCSPLTNLRQSKLLSKTAAGVLAVHALLFILVLISLIVHMRHERRRALYELQAAFPQQTQADPYLTGQ